MTTMMRIREMTLRQAPARAICLMDTSPEPETTAESKEVMGIGVAPVIHHSTTPPTQGQREIAAPFV